MRCLVVVLIGSSYELSVGFWMTSAAWVTANISVNGFPFVAFANLKNARGYDPCESAPPNDPGLSYEPGIEAAFEFFDDAWEWKEV